MVNEVLLSNVIEEISMGPFGSDITIDNFVDKGVPVLNGSNLEGFKLKEDSFKYVTEEKAKTFRKAIAKRGDIVVTHRGTLGQISYIPENSNFEKYVISQSQFRVRFNERKIDPRYIVYLFHTPYGQKKLLSFKNHVGVPALAQATTNFRKLDLLIHEIGDQRKIANILNALDAKIELNRRINTELEAMAKTLYDYWFVQFDFPDAQGRPYKSSGGKMVWCKELWRAVPEGWGVRRLSDLLPVITGKKDANFATRDGNFKFFTCSEEILKCDSFEFDGKAILVAGNGNFNIKLYEGKFNAYQRTYVLIPDDERYYTVIYFVVRDQIKSLISGARGSIVKFITKGDLERISIVLPTSDYSKLFLSLNTIIKKIELTLEENQKLAELRDWLLPMLMNGQVRVG
jgi:type I restriction enzyme S subunit